MGNNVRVFIKADQLGYLGRISGQTLNSVSPLNAQVTEPSSAEIDDLKKNGVLSGPGAVNDGFRSVLAILAGPAGFTRLRLTKGRGLLEYVVFFAPGGDSCSLMTDNDGFWLEYPAVGSDITRLLEELIGSSTLRNVEFEADFDRSQGLVLAAAVDITRRAMLKALTENSEYVDADFSPEEVALWLKRDSADAQWLGAIVKGLLPGADLEMSGVIDSLEKLTHSGFMQKSSTKFTLNEQAAALSSRILIIDKLLSLRSGSSIGAEMAQVGFICLSAGVNDLLMIDTDENRIYMETVSARQIIDYSSHMLSEPVKPVKSSAPAPADAAHGSAPAAPAAVICKSCGAELSDKAKFCNSCGSPVKASPAFCGKCGAEIKKGARFCGGCGTPL